MRPGGADQLVDLVYVRNRCTRPCRLGEQIKRHIVIVADRRKGQIRIVARVGFDWTPMSATKACTHSRVRFRVQTGHWADIAASQQDCAKNVP
jgi:hypothetical protein